MSLEPTSKSLRHRLIMAGIVILFVIMIVAYWLVQSPVARPLPAVLAGASNVVSGSASPLSSTIIRHPFAVVHESPDYGWTAEDGMNTNVIRQLARNPSEYQRMLSENRTIYRRQLVYHPAGFTLLAQHALQAKRGIRQLTLPGLDGQEFAVMVTKTDFESGGDRGLFYGQLPGRTNSMVTVTFVNGQEAFTVISPQDHVYLQAEAREPGEILVKSINPETYGGHAN